jgi:hypothetical protein
MAVRIGSAAMAEIESRFVQNELLLDFLAGRI